MHRMVTLFAVIFMASCPGTETTDGSMPKDALLPDASQQDTLQTDTRQPDGFIADANRQDAVLVDASQQDTSLPDANQQDIFLPDANQQDTLLPDASQPDANLPDSNQQDTSLLDAGQTIGSTYYVSNSGNNNANGLSPATAWQTIDKVNRSSFSPGDNILFKRGDTWNAQLLVPSNGDETGYITFGAYGSGAKPIIDGTGVSLSRNHGLIRGSDINYIIVENIRVQNSGIGDAMENSGIGFYSGSNLIIRHCEVYRTESAGIKMNVNSHVGVFYNDVTMTNCNSASEQISLSTVDVFEVAFNDSYTNCNANNSPSGGAGIDSKGGSKNGTIHHNNVWDINGANGIYVDAFNLDTYNIEVYNNHVRDISAGGIMIGAESGGALHDVVVHHNIVETAKKGGLVFHNQGPTGDSVYDIFIYNNTFNLNGTEGVNYYGGVRIFDARLTAVTLKNNIFSNSFNFQIGVDDVSPSVVTLDYNVIYGVNVDTGGFTHLDGTNTISDNPLYTAAASSDYHLQSGSPARLACDNSVWVGVPNVVDFDGVMITDTNGDIVAPGGTVSCGAFQ